MKNDTAWVSLAGLTVDGVATAQDCCLQKMERVVIVILFDTDISDIIHSHTTSDEIVGWILIKCDPDDILYSISIIVTMLYDTDILYIVMILMPYDMIGITLDAGCIKLGLSHF